MKKEMYVSIMIISILILSGCAKTGGQKTIEASSKDKQTGTVFSMLKLTMPSKAFDKTTKIGIVSVPAFKPDRYVGGHYILTPQNAELKEPATLLITYTQEAVALFKSNYPTFDENVYNLSIAYYDEKTINYVPIESTYDRSSRTVSAYITKFYGGGFVIFPIRNS